MATIVFFCIPAWGHTNPTLGVVRELVHRGHEVLYYSYEPLRGAIEAAGARFVPCDDFDAQLHLTPEEGRRVGRDLALSTRVLVDNLMPRFYRDCIAALGDTEYQVVLSVGADTDIPALGPLPENVEVYPTVDQMALLEKADVFLTHCDMNSANEALSYGVPLICLPQTTEQGGVAARVEALGAGVLLKKPSVQSIREAVERVLREEGCRRSAQELARGFAHCPGPAGAADKILAVAGVS